MASLVFYITTYALTVLGAFGVANIVQERTGEEKLSAFAGLSKRAPLLSFCMMIFMLSLAGIPPLAGFFGKFYLFASAIGGGKNLGLLWLVIFAIAMSAVSLYYYLQVLKQIYVSAAPANAPAIQSTVLTRLVIGSLALGVLVLGCAPGLFLQKIIPAIAAALPNIKVAGL
jgi:NADH-quinone oxidoreductase subunit N